MWDASSSKKNPSYSQQQRHWSAPLLFAHILRWVFSATLAIDHAQVALLLYGQLFNGVLIYTHWNIGSTFVHRWIRNWIVVKVTFSKTVRGNEEWQIESVINEPAQDKTYNKNCVTSKDSDQLVHPHSMARGLVYSSLDRLETVEGTCDQLRLVRLCWCAGWFESSLVAQVLLYVLSCTGSNDKNARKWLLCNDNTDKSAHLCSLVWIFIKCLKNHYVQHNISTNRENSYQTIDAQADLGQHSLFTWHKCQFLAKECAQYWLTA